MRDSYIARHINDSNSWHKAVMSLFDNYTIPNKEARKTLGVVFRKEVRDSGVYIYIQSKVEPNLDKNKETHKWVKQIDTKDLNPIIDSFKEGMKLKFDLLCTPYKVVRVDSPKGKIRCISDRDEKIQWLKDKEPYNGFKVLYCDVISCNETLENIGGTSKGRLYLTKLQGVLEITDVEKFKDFYASGVGRQRAYGAGMLMIF